jgi:hypothetical protein
MAQAQVERALHTKLEGDATEDESVCVEKNATRGYSGIAFMFENRRLARISVWKPSRVKTPRGIGIGVKADKVKQAYGHKLKTEPHEYLDLPAEYLTFWTVPGRRGVRFETDLKRRVQVIHAGTSAIQYIEGCA